MAVGFLSMKVTDDVDYHTLQLVEMGEKSSI